MVFFNKNISFLRKKKKLTIAVLSSEIGFSTSQWNNYELGISYPKFLDLIKISKYFDVLESDLIHKNIELDKDFSNETPKNKDKTEAVLEILNLSQYQQILNMQASIIKDKEVIIEIQTKLIAKLEKETDYDKSSQRGDLGNSKAAIGVIKKEQTHK